MQGENYAEKRYVRMAESRRFHDINILHNAKKKSLTFIKGLLLYVNAHTENSGIIILFEEGQK